MVNNITGLGLVFGLGWWDSLLHTDSKTWLSKSVSHPVRLQYHFLSLHSTHCNTQIDGDNHRIFGNLSYPDCRRQFFGVSSRHVGYGTRNEKETRVGWATGRAIASRPLYGSERSILQTS